MAVCDTLGDWDCDAVSVTVCEAVCVWLGVCDAVPLVACDGVTLGVAACVSVWEAVSVTDSL